ncbi:MAG: hypothetical protein LBM66_03560 [Bifidobacteriaceae bacterium]|jgi:hypothetical protein|nr:hypothetical protein [Bifidobacteriaceae bacterium]
MARLRTAFPHTPTLTHRWLRVAGAFLALTCAVGLTAACGGGSHDATPSYLPTNASPNTKVPSPVDTATLAGDQLKIMQYLYTLCAGDVHNAASNAASYAAEMQAAGSPSAAAAAQTAVNPTQAVVIDTGGEVPTVDGDYATVNYRCVNNPYNRTTEHMYLVKDQNGNWEWKMTAPRLPNCRDVEGSSWPEAIIGKTCHDTTTNKDRDTKFSASQTASPTAQGPDLPSAS